MIGPQLPPEGLPKAQQEDDGEQHASYDSFQHSSITHAGSQQVARIIDVTELKRVCKLQMGAGLQNLGNSCYMNSVLQCLAYIPPVASAYQLNHLHGFDCPCPLKRKGQACTGCLVEHQLKLQTNGSRSIPIRPHALHSQLQRFSKAFVRGRQEDAHEFLLSVLDAVERDCKRALGMLGHSKVSRTLVEQLFYGQLQNQVRCLSCGHVSSTHEMLTTLSLDLHNITSIEDSLAQYMAAEILDGDNKYKCDKCNKLVKARKWVDLKKEPNVLAIHLKRFNAWTIGKVSRLISFPFVLRLKQQCTAAVPSDSQAQYMLFGVVVHSGGSVHSGHYVAYVRDSTGNWWCANDSTVYPVSKEHVLGQQAYLLFYSRTSALVPWPHEPPSCKKQPATPIALTATSNSISPHSHHPKSPSSNTPRAVFGPALPQEARQKPQPVTDATVSRALPTISSQDSSVTTASVTRLGPPAQGKAVVQLQPRGVQTQGQHRSGSTAVVKATPLNPAVEVKSSKKHYANGNGHDNGHIALPAEKHLMPSNGVSNENGNNQQSKKRLVQTTPTDEHHDIKRLHIGPTSQQTNANSTGNGHGVVSACANGNHQHHENGNTIHHKTVSYGVAAAMTQEQADSKHADEQQPDLRALLCQVRQIVYNAYRTQPGYVAGLREEFRQKQQQGITLDEVLHDDALRRQARLPVKDLLRGHEITNAGKMIEGQIRQSL